MSGRYRIVDMKPAHLLEIRNRLRSGDAMEITCLGLGISRALWRSYRSSLISRTAYVDGEIAAVWGCGGSALGGIGEPWLLTSPAIEKIPVSFVREARQEVNAMLGIFPVLQNYVAANYRQACRFLECVGFDLGEAFPAGPARAPFRQFRKER